MSRLDVAEQPLDDPKRMLHLCADVSLDFFKMLGILVTLAFGVAEALLTVQFCFVPSHPYVLRFCDDTLIIDAHAKHSASYRVLPCASLSETVGGVLICQFMAKCGSSQRMQRSCAGYQ